MADYLTPEARSALMSRIRGKDTGPEMTVRRIVHALGYRYRLHCRDLPGTPDLVFRRLRKIIFIHGCFWHRHENCPYAYTPKSRQSFWRKKFRLNKQRDLLQLRRLNSGRLGGSGRLGVRARLSDIGYHKDQRLPRSRQIPIEA